MNNPLEDRADYSRTPANPACVPDRCAGRRLDLEEGHAGVIGALAQ